MYIVSHVVIFRPTGAAQFGIFEGSKIAATVWGHGTVFPFILFSLALFAFYSLVPKVRLATTF